MDRRWLAGGAVALCLVLAAVYVGFATGAVAPYLGGYDPPETVDAGPNGTEDGAGAGTPTASESTPDHGPGLEYEHTTVRVVDDNGTEKGRVAAAVADTLRKRYVGLSNTESLPADRGMLFVHDSTGDRTYVMRNMSFGIDIVFADADGTITEIHHAPEPGPDEDGESQGYSGEGKYVLEVNYEWTAERGVEPGDRLEFEVP